MKINPANINAEQMAFQCLALDKDLISSLIEIRLCLQMQSAYHNFKQEKPMAVTNSLTVVTAN